VKLSAAPDKALHPADWNAAKDEVQELVDQINESLEITQNEYFRLSGSESGGVWRCESEMKDPYGNTYELYIKANSASQTTKKICLILKSKGKNGLTGSDGKIDSDDSYAVVENYKNTIFSSIIAEKTDLDTGTAVPFSGKTGNDLMFDIYDAETQTADISSIYFVDTKS
jgi:hypothetical protein